MISSTNAENQWVITHVRVEVLEATRLPVAFSQLPGTYTGADAAEPIHPVAKARAGTRAS